MKHYLSALFWGCIFVFLFPLYSTGQDIGSYPGINLNKTLPTPQTASLGEFGLIPPDPFTGQANVSIPLYNLAYKDLEVPITLSYSTKGNQVDEHPGWVGQGWSLNAGGVIYRKVNGLQDEHVRRLGNTYYSNEICYLYNSYKVKKYASDTNFVKEYANNSVLSVSSFLDFDAQPDEFIFNFNGHAGVFYFQGDSAQPIQIKVKSSNGEKLKIELLDTLSSLTYDDVPLNELPTSTFLTKSTSRVLYQFKITDEKGIQYIFGGTPNSIELNNNGDYTDDSYTIASAWYLTEIRNPAGYSILFNYKRAGRTYTQHMQRSILAFKQHSSLHVDIFYVLSYTNKSNFDNYYDGSTTHVTVQNPVFLSSIVTPLQTINFTSSRCKDLGYIIADTTFSKINRIGSASDLLDSSMWQKLNQIDIVGVKKINFNYLESRTRRLQLTGINLSTPYDRVIQQYGFTYDTTLLPKYYNLQQADHWGYYNGKTYKYDTNYLVSRAPDSTYMKAEILKKITFPTGGYTEFVYEPHTYRKVALQLPYFNLEEHTTDSIAGGLRIKKIISTADANAPSITKEYFYVTDYIHGGTASSGILAGHPTYYATGSGYSHNNSGPAVWGNSWSGTGTVDYHRVLDNNFLPLGTTNGNHMTYSEVTEKGDGGYTVYKFSNHDNGYVDRIPTFVASNFSATYFDEQFISNEPFRGLLLNQAIYNGNKQLLKESAYTYYIDTTGADYKLAYIHNITDLSTYFPLVRVNTGFYYLKPALVKSVTITDYDPATSASVKAITSNLYYPDINPGKSAAYDNYQVAKSTLTTSKNESLTTVYSYPYSRILANTDTAGIYKAMLDRNMNSISLGKVQFRNNEQLQLTNLSFYNPYTGVYVPKYFQTSQGAGTLSTEDIYDIYDNMGNLQQVTNKGGMQESYIWDYKGQYPIAQVTNAANRDVAYSSFEGDTYGGWGGFDNIVVDSTSPGGIHCYGLGHTSNLLFYLEKTGLSSDKTYVLSYWSNGGTATVAGSVAVKKGKTINGWTYYEHTIKNVTATDLTGSTHIDELRLYPADAQMKSYWYNPLVGMTGTCNERNIFTYYEYDSYGRLHVMRDQDRNIIKLICYNYYGQAEICNEHIFYNTEQKKDIRKSCNSPYMGTVVTYTVKANTYSSDVSQDDANAKAIAEINTYGQTYANTKGYCYFPNDSITITVKKNNCGADSVPSSVSWFVPKGKYLSAVSIAQADSIAYATEIDSAQLNANAKGVCSPCTVFLTKAADAGDLPIFNLAITNSSTGESLLNKTYLDPTSAMLTCLALPKGIVYNITFTTQSGTSLYIRQNGTETVITGTSKTYLLGAGASFELSTKAQTVYKNSELNLYYQKTNCSANYTGSYVKYTVAAGTYSSLTPGVADSLARVQANTYGPSNANTSSDGFCYPAVDNVVIKEGSKTPSGVYTIKLTSGTTTLKSYSYIILDSNLPIYDVITPATATVVIATSSPMTTVINNTTYRIAANDTLSVIASTPIIITVSGQ